MPMQSHVTLNLIGVPICKMIFPFFSKIIVASSGPPPEQASI